MSGETVGQRVRRLRLEQGRTMRSLSSPGVTYAYVSRIEDGTRNPSVKALRLLADKLGVSPEYLETGMDAVTATATADEIHAEAGRWGVRLRLDELTTAERARLEQRVRGEVVEAAGRALLDIGAGRHLSALPLDEGGQDDPDPVA